MRMVAALRSADRPAFATSFLSQFLLSLALLALLVLWLAALGRPVLCPCGTVALWVGDVRSPQSSQQVADWYSLLHIVFGFALFLFLDWMKPAWRLGQTFVVAIASSVVWEAIENLPAVIAVFGNASNSPPYSGDSILNAVSDTVFVGFGFLVASRLPPLVTLGLAVAFEALVWHRASDGYALGLLRLIGVPV